MIMTRLLASYAAPWLWLFPITYVIHIAEEYWGGGGFSAHMAAAKGVRLTRARFLFLTGLGLLLMIVGIRTAQALGFPQLLCLILGGVVLLNGLSHAFGSITTKAYNPGLITGVLLWLPLGAITLLALREKMPAQRYMIGVAIAEAIQVTVSALAQKSGEKMIKE